MPRTFYTDYVSHCMRFYTRFPKPDLKNEKDVLNWQACDKAIGDFSEEEQEILKFLYSERDTMADNIYNISTKKGIKQKKIWGLIGDLEEKIAKNRGLI